MAPYHVMNSNTKLFGTDGIRGLANSPDMNTEVAVALGRAAAYFSRNSGELPKIVIGKDTRLSGYMLETALSSGVTSMGVDVVRTGPLPTPGIAFICRSMRARMGIVISASHNPADHNGLKLFGEDGFKLSEQQESEVEDIIHNRKFEQNLAKPDKVGKILQIDDASGRYVQYLKERFPYRLTLKGLKIAVDAANGAAYKVAPAVFSELGAEVVIMADSPSGYNINDGCGALYPEKICNLTTRSGADIGITVDGDADRLLLSDDKGNLVDGDGILYISARHLHSKGRLGGNTVVGTAMTNYGLDMALKKLGISVVRTEVGDQKVISYMKEHNINLGGESCGHLIYLHHSTTGDAILAALRILSIMQQQREPLSHLVEPFKPFPQKTINVAVREKIDIDQIPEITQLRHDIEHRLEGRGRVVLRYSGTEMVARVTVESDDEKTTKECAQKLALAIERHLGTNASQ
ncbi:MAG: phosphoglucosamine mutase [Pseudomonadota bacterium]